MVDAGKIVTIVCMAGLSAALLASVLYAFVSADAAVPPFIPPGHQHRPQGVPFSADATKFKPAVDTSEAALAPVNEPSADHSIATQQIAAVAPAPTPEPVAAQPQAIGVDVLPAKPSGESGTVDGYQGVEWAEA